MEVMISDTSDDRKISEVVSGRWLLALKIAATRNESSERKKEILVRVILVTEILESENLDPENPVLGNFRPRNASAWKGQCKEISEQGNPSAR